MRHLNANCTRYDSCCFECYEKIDDRERCSLIKLAVVDGNVKNVVMEGVEVKYKTCTVSIDSLNYR